MKKTLKRLLSMLMAVLLLVVVMTGCSTPDSNEIAAPTPKATATPASEVTTAPATEPEEIVFPLLPEVTELTIFWRLNPKATASMKDYSEMGLVQELENRTNIRLKFVHPPIGQDTEQFNLMRASGDFPDIVYWENWLNPITVGGPEKALKDNFIIPLNDLMAQYAPNLTGLMEAESDIKRNIMTDDGTLYGFPLLRYNQSMKGVWGYIIREDWVKKLGLEMPVTVEDFYNTLVAFRDKDPNGNGEKDEIPFSGPKGRYVHLLYPWGITNDFINKEGKVVYGPYTEEYRQALTELSKWYSEGLIDPDFAVNDERQAEGRLLAEKSGAYWGETGGSTGLIMKSFEEQGKTENKLVGIPIPKIEAGAMSYNYNMDRLYDGVATTITPANQYPVETVKFLDYAYSDEGQLLYNFGIEGESYNMIDGKPVLSDMITKNPDGLSMDQALARYSFGSMQASMVFMPAIRDQRMLFYDWQVESINAWNQDDKSQRMPPTTLSIEENTRYAEIMADIQTYMEENFNNFLQGTQPMSEFDNYLSQLKSMGIEEAIELKQSALDRFLNR